MTTFPIGVLRNAVNPPTASRNVSTRLFNAPSTPPRPIATASVPKRSLRFFVFTPNPSICLLAISRATFERYTSFSILSKPTLPASVKALTAEAPRRPKSSKALLAVGTTRDSSSTISEKSFVSGLSLSMSIPASWKACCSFSFGDTRRAITCLSPVPMVEALRPALARIIAADADSSKEIPAL